MMMMMQLWQQTQENHNFPDFSLTYVKFPDFSGFYK